MTTDEHFETVIIGGGQAGLAVGYHLRSQEREFVILDGKRACWRFVAQALALASAVHPGNFDGLPGMAFPAPAHSYPTGLEMADYLESYAKRFELPVRSGVTVDELDRNGERIRRDRRRSSARRGQRGRRDGCVPARTPDRSRVRGRARSRDSAAPLGRLPRTGAAAAGAGARRRCFALGRRHRVRGCARGVPDRPLRKGHRPDPGPAR